MIRQMVLVQRMAKVSPNIKLLTYCTIKSNLTIAKKAYFFTRALLKYCKDVKVNPFFFAAYNLFQIPVFFLMVMSIRKISYEEDLQNSGILWFKNLNEADPYMILPIFSVALTYYNLGRGINKDNEHWFINRWRSFFQVIQICYLPFTCQWPAVIYLYIFILGFSCLLDNINCSYFHSTNYPKTSYCNEQD
jgi:membrane protein insertase Oxa1/YidC/SpoIIIJ